MKKNLTQTDQLIEKLRHCDHYIEAKKALKEHPNADIQAALNYSEKARAVLPGIIEESKTPIYQKLARLMDAHENCTSEEWKEKHKESIDWIIESYFSLSIRIQKEDGILKVHGSHMAMDDMGYQIGYLTFTVNVNPCLLFGFELSIEIEDRELWEEIEEQGRINLDGYIDLILDEIDYSLSKKL